MPLDLLMEEFNEPRPVLGNIIESMWSFFVAKPAALLSDAGGFIDGQLGGIIGSHYGELFLFTVFVGFSLVYLWNQNKPYSFHVAKIDTTLRLTFAYLFITFLVYWADTSTAGVVPAFSDIVVVGSSFSNATKALVFASGLFLFWINSRVFKLFFFSKILIEQFILLLLVLLLGGLLATCNHILFLFVCLTGLSVCLYVLIAQTKHVSSMEAATKYFTLGLLSVGFLLFGSLLVYAEYGDLSYTTIRAVNALASEQNGALPAVTFLGWVGLVFILLSLLFKLSAFPGFIWAADVYEGSSLFVVSVLLVVVKPVVFLALLNLLSAFTDLKALWSPLLILAACGSFFVGTFGAIMQQKIKRFLAFSSINHIGFVLAGLAVEVESGLLASVYLGAYVLSSIVLFGALMGIRRRDGTPLVYLTELSGIWYQNKVLGSLIVVSMFSLGGIPPFIGFWAKYGIMVACVSSGTVWGFLAFGAISAFLVFATFNYLRVIKNMCFRMERSAVSSEMLVCATSAPILALMLLALVVLVGGYIVFTLVITTQYQYTLGGQGLAIVEYARALIGG